MVVVCGFSSIWTDQIRKGNDDRGGGGTTEFGGEKVERKDEEIEAIIMCYNMHG